MSKLFKRGGIWYCHVIGHDGTRRQVSTRCTDHAAAVVRRRQLERRAVDPDHAPAKPEASLTAAVRLLLATRNEQAHAGRRSHATVDFYTRKAGHLVRVLEGVPDDGTYRPLPLAQLDAVAVDRYISTRRGEKAGENTISKELITLRGALRLALRHGLWSGQIDAVLPIAFAPQYQPRERALSPAELPALLAELGPDHAARVAFIVATSACASEAEHARLEDVTAGGAHVHEAEAALVLRRASMIAPVRTIDLDAFEDAEALTPNAAVTCYARQPVRTQDAARNRGSARDFYGDAGWPLE